MRRIQIHLDEETDEALALEAFERGISKAALIREYLARHVPTKKRGADPSRELVGAYDGDEDESSRIDDVAYDR